MKIGKKEKGAVIIYSLEGRIDFHPFDLLDESVLKDALESDRKYVILDFSELKYISSLGIRYIYDIKNKLTKQGIKFAIVKVSDAVIQVFKLLGLMETFSIYEKEEDAIQSFGVGN
ncbi:MAG: STAS domain-containing protein [Leptospira sp.]|nr:STAS domain-containing protein [Leptospira sp.]NCS94032.1 STAS domain-containing protein [Leptospira sp.]